MILFSALKNKNYRLFFAGQGFSNLGNMMKQVAIGWLVYRLTDSAFLLGVVTFSRELSAFFFSSVAGVIADRYNKHHLLIFSHSLIMVNAFVLAYLTLNGTITVFSMVVIQILFGCISGIEMPSRQSFVNDLVEDKSYLTNAIALNSSLFNTARIAGPAIAGLLIPLIGEGYCFLTYGFMSMAVVIFFLFIKYKTFSKKETKLNFKLEFMEGFNYSYQVQPIRTLMIFVAAITMLGVSYIVILPVFATKVFHAGAEVFGYMTSAIGLGSLVGAFYLGNKKNVMGLDKLIFFAAIIFGAGVAVFALSEILWFSLLALMVAGLGRVVVFTSVNTLLQTIAVADKRGRVLSLYIMLFMGALSLGSFLVGIFADLIGAPITLFAGGAGCVLVALYFGKNLASFRRMTYRTFRQNGVV